MLLEKERKDKVVRFLVSSSLREKLLKAAALSGAEDFSEWARKTLTREAEDIIQEEEEMGITGITPSDEDIFS